MSRQVIAQWTHIHHKMAGIDGHAGAASDGSAWAPNTDVYDGPDGLVVKVELAAVTRESVDLWIDDRALVISGIRRDPYTGATGAGYRFRQMEIEYGPFHRVVPLPYPVDAAGASAQCEHGILEIHLPRAPEAPKKQIPVRLQAPS